MRFENPFKAHRPRHRGKEREACSQCREKDFGDVSQELLKWIEEQSNHPGELISLQPDTHADLSKTVKCPTIAGHIEKGGEPTERIHDLKEISVVSINMNALGGSRMDRDYRSDNTLSENEQQFLAFLQKTDSSTSFVCLQDFPLYRLRVLGPKLQKMGFSYYANVVGINGQEPGHLAALVTLVNTSHFKGYVIPLPELSMTKHWQNMRKSSDGRKITYEQGTPEDEAVDWDVNYGKSHKNEALRHAFQTFNTKLTIQGTDGEKVIAIGNLYMSPPSLQIERSRNVKYSLEHLSTLSGADGVAILTGDFNVYGVDTTAKTPLHISAHPVLTGASAVLRRDLKEVTHIEKIAGRLGYAKSDLGRRPTITAAGGVVGMQLDHTMANVPADALQTTVERVPFTDHKASRTIICITSRE